MKAVTFDLMISFAKYVAGLSISPENVEDAWEHFLTNNKLDIHYEAPTGNSNELLTREDIERGIRSFLSKQSE